MENTTLREKASKLYAFINYDEERKGYHVTENASTDAQEAISRIARNAYNSDIDLCYRLAHDVLGLLSDGPEEIDDMTDADEIAERIDDWTGGFDGTIPIWNSDLYSMIPSLVEEVEDSIRECGLSKDYGLAGAVMDAYRRALDTALRETIKYLQGDEADDA